MDAFGGGSEAECGAYSCEWLLVSTGLRLWRPVGPTYQLLLRPGGGSPMARSSVLDSYEREKLGCPWEASASFPSDNLWGGVEGA